MTDEFPSMVADTSGTRYELGALLGHGGQGAVFAVRGRPLAVKILDATTASARLRTQESVARVKRMHLEGLTVARPLRALAPPFVGYVMELMTDMEPLTRLANVPEDRSSNLAPWYLETGGLRRRLRLLARTAEILAEMHGRGLSYGDASPNNIFVSEDPNAQEVWLIDCDNVDSGVRRRAVYTPGYAAPELLRSRGSDSLTDAWSFATIAFQTLCALHPFVGDDVHDGEPECEAKAFEGLLPWVDDPSGENEASRGLPREMVMTPDLRELAEDCFGRGRTERQQRPGVASWAEKLYRAADQVLICTACGSTFYLNCRICPWCDAPRPSFAIASVYLRDPELTDRQRNPFNLVCREAGRPRPVHRVAIQAGQPLTLSDRILRGTANHAAIVEASLHEQRLTVMGRDGAAWVLRHQTGRELPLAGRTEHLDLAANPKSWWLLPDAPEGLHRALAFEWVPGVQG